MPGAGRFAFGWKMLSTAGFCCLAAAAIAAAAEAPSRFVKLDGARLHYKSYGKGQEALVFIHGFSCDLTFWRLQAAVYEKRRSLLMDLPGHGASDKPEAAYTQELFARAVEAVMRDARVEKAVLVGHSMGTWVAIVFLLRYPQKASGLVIVDGVIPSPPKNEAERQKMAAMAESMKKMDYRTSLTRMVDWMFTGQTPAAMRDEIRAKMLSTPHHVVASAMEEMIALADIVQPQLKDKRFEAPAMAIFARREKGPPSPGYEDYLRSLFPQLRSYQVWDGAGHFLMMEQPEKFNAALLEFLDRK